MRKVVAVALSATMAVTLSTAAESSAKTKRHVRRTHALVITTRRLPKLGKVLVSSSGRTLYMFAPDKRKKVTCVSTCQSMWPAAKLPRGARAIGKGGVRTRLLGSDRNPSGGRVITYDGWPLYTYVGDGSAGAANGQALNVSGGLWYVLSPAGKVIRTKR